IKEGNCIAYQCAEVDGGPCGRTFEDAFILANQALFELTGGTRDELEVAARSKAAEFKKSEFALKYAIEEKGWGAPRYLVDGVRWLAAGIEPDLSDPALALAADAIVASVETAPHG
ncbi:ATP-dependent endonuclease, partial [Burkholderia cenocepacia]|nr:ATP-dependent endonuclease [Burkholderia cenocepacia]